VMTGINSVMTRSLCATRLRFRTPPHISACGGLAGDRSFGSGDRDACGYACEVLRRKTPDIGATAASPLLRACPRLRERTDGRLVQLLDGVCVDGSSPATRSRSRSTKSSRSRAPRTDVNCGSGDS
jgi:hypothetical protein